MKDALQATLAKWRHAVIDEKNLKRRVVKFGERCRVAGHPIQSVREHRIVPVEELCRCQAQIESALRVVQQADLTLHDGWLVTEHENGLVRSTITMWLCCDLLIESTKRLIVQSAASVTMIQSSQFVLEQHHQPALLA